jgi:hypothetical protein
MTDTVKAWQCIGCGSIEAPQTCIGVCQHRKVEFVYAREHEQALAQATHLHQRLATFVRRVAATTPRDHGAAATLAAFRGEARALLAELRTADATH